jgi:imidazolonepropionase-like amidohydrolase
LKTLNKKRVFYLLLIVMGLVTFPFVTASFAQMDPPLALINGNLIDGTGAAPIQNAVLIIENGKVIAAGKTEEVSIPKNAQVIQLQNATIMPGFFNVHVHTAFNATRLATWAKAGVTSVREMEIHSGESVSKKLSLRSGELNQLNNARLFMVGPMITVPGGYGSLPVASPEDARKKVTALINAGVDVIKISLEDGYAGTHGLPKLSPEELKTIITTAHEYGKRVTIHITQAYYLEQAVNAGVDEVAHDAWDNVPLDVIKKMVRKNIYWIPTFTIFRNYGAPVGVCIENLKNFYKLGGRVAMGNDFAGGPGEFENGIPMYEIECMKEAGMSSMDIIVAATKNGAYVCGKADTLGTLEPGKIADVLVVAGDPLKDLQTLPKTLLILKDGNIICNNLFPKK